MGVVNGKWAGFKDFTCYGQLRLTRNGMLHVYYNISARREAKWICMQEGAHSLAGQIMWVHYTQPGHMGSLAW